ncbi:hypothetical protein [Leucobacter denitrificans]|uniref:TRAP transporter substrate-binding protein DctP n=1 Tax=Leucobacter denitrificans TaxID=683042 RepID=A0A7G9S566_9MICO|nr:hypothetical protein [Leucobacter denitrificans]QNN62991.1 hypothetical protein H9L06_00965 [Leucobacter denitrificans]
MKYQKNARKRRLISSVGLVASATLLLAACAGGDSGDKGGDSVASEDFSPVTLSYADVGGESTNGAPFYAFADEVAAATDDKVTFESFFSGSLLGVTDSLGGVQSGTADLSYVGASAFPNEIPIAHWNNSMGAVSSSTYPLSILQGYIAQQEWALSDPELTAELDANNLMVIWNSLPDTRTALICKDEPVLTLEDAKGKRLGVSGTPPSLPEMERLGFTQVQLSPVEWYEGLQRGVVDCVGGTPTAAATYSLFEVAKHWTFADFNGSPGTYTMMNKEKFESLPTAAQDAIWDALPTWLVERGKEWIKNYEALVTAQDEYDVSFYDPDEDFQNLVVDEQAKAYEALADSAPDTVADPAAFLDNFRSIYDKWETRLSEELDLPTEHTKDTLEEIAEFDSDAIDWDVFRDMLAEVYDAHRPTA